MSQANEKASKRKPGIEDVAVTPLSPSLVQVLGVEPNCVGCAKRRTRSGTEKDADGTSTCTTMRMNGHAETVSHLDCFSCLVVSHTRW